MDEQVLNIIEGLIESRNIFLGRTINQIHHSAREGAYSRYLLNELCMLEVVSRVYQHSVRTEHANTQTFTITPGNYTVTSFLTGLNAAVANGLNNFLKKYGKLPVHGPLGEYTPMPIIDGSPNRINQK